ncbi:GumC family protein [Flavihumibacter solisilvae]|uniref:GumC family protein n=1 Tax=Flavihumibacter solisilvae TaxID=1349421 RepID=UPI001364921D|nr:polysaccharide biosynthesis tyrosine autokinase [Flavihumibacter solisilvae]
MPLFILSAVIFLSLAFIYSKWIQRSYEINASILIKDEKKGIDESQMLEALDIFRGKKIVENEIEVLRSRKFIKQVVNSLGLYVQVKRKEKYRTVDLYSEAPVKVLFRDPAQMKPAEKIHFAFDEKAGSVRFGDSSYALNSWVRTKWGEAIFFRNNSNGYLPSNGEIYYVLVSPKMIEQELLSRLEVITGNKLASLVELRIKDTDPKRGEDILNELMHFYTQAEVDDKNRLAGNMLSSVEARLRYTAGQLDSVESAIQNYRTSAGVIDISEQSRLYLENVGQNERMVQELNTKLAVLDAVERYIQASTDQTAGTSALMVDDPTLSQMLTQLNDAQQQYAKLRITTGENSPIIMNVKEQINKLKPSILGIVKSQRTNLEIGRQNLMSSGTRYSSMLRTIPGKEKQLLEISRQQSIKNQIYSYLLERREEAALSYAAAKADSRIIDVAESSIYPVSPKMRYIYLGALLFSAFAVILLVSLREGMNKKILFRKEIEQLSDIPVGTELFHSGRKKFLVYNDKEKSAVIEQIRSLRNAIAFGEKNVNHKVFYISSYTRKEGKSYVAANLACSLAATGKRTLLIDMDVDTLGNSKAFGLDVEKGFTNYLKEEGVRLDEIVHKLPDAYGLRFIPAGTMTEGGIELTSQHQLENLLRTAREQFDYVVVCSAPVSSNANMELIGQMCDMRLLIVRHGVTPKYGNTLLEAAAQSGNTLNSLIIFNGVRSRGVAGRTYGYGGHYGFGYDLKVAR